MPTSTPPGPLKRGEGQDHGTAEPGGHALGRSRGGLATKNHLACEQRQMPMSVVVTAGQRGDAPQFEPVMERIRVVAYGRSGPARTRPERVRADKAYSSKRIRSYPRRRTVPESADRCATPSARGSAGVVRPALTGPTTAPVTRSSAGSTSSNTTGRRPHAKTNSPFATRPPTRSLPPTNSFDYPNTP
ncbi:hypothetical protein CDO52_07050 [Nocardiopsis gilva YIM 90087]|uniref:Transposase IS4-like domain-containing protein n=1 Tax=Nocardiopsis gilva YIM 90087 TaxID=1235441 RepID=A0A223S367_9ACTN|nr:hypothetical protein CDO52_07050 [Nocardiopsis gilva YIM 90087]